MHSLLHLCLTLSLLYKVFLILLEASKVWAKGRKVGRCAFSSEKSNGDGLFQVGNLLFLLLAFSCFRDLKSTKSGKKGKKVIWQICWCTFWSGKFNSTQQNYPVHEQELLAIIESLKWFQHLLQGMKFHIFTDHKGPEWICTQQKLSPCQARWLKVLANFDFEIIHVPGKANVLTDALSCIYSDEPKGTVRASSEFVSVEEEHSPSELLLNLVTVSLYTGSPIFLGAMTQRCWSCTCTRCNTLTECTQVCSTFNHV